MNRCMTGVLVAGLVAVAASVASAGVFTFTSPQTGKVNGNELAGTDGPGGGAVTIADSDAGGGLLYNLTTGGYGGLDMGAYSIGSSISSTTLGLALNLNGQGIAGTGANNIGTSNAGHTGPLVISNCAGVYAGDLDAHAQGNNEAGSVTVTHTGNFNANSVLTYGKTGEGQTFTGNGTGVFTVRNTGISLNASRDAGAGNSIVIGGYVSMAIAGDVLTYGVEGSGGTLSIGTAGSPISGGVSIGGDVKTYGATATTVGADAGAITVYNNGGFSARSIDATAFRNAKAHLFTGNNSGAFQTVGGGLETHFATGNPGSVTITGYTSISINGNLSTHCSSATAIRDGGPVSLTSGGSIEIAGDITTYTTSGNNGAAVTVNHGGDFAVGSVKSYGGLRAGGKQTFTGNGAGAFLATDSLLSYGGNYNQGSTTYLDISISGYTSVTIQGDIRTYTLHTSPKAGNLAVTGVAGDLTIGGAIDLNSPTDTNEGNLTLTCGGNITLASLDLGLVKDVSLTTGGGASNYVWIQSEPVGLSDSEGPPRTVKGFLSVNSHVYYTDGAGPLSGTYNILDAANADTGFDLIAGDPPAQPSAGTVILVM